MEKGEELHVIFGTGALGMAVTRELIRKGKRLRLVNRRGRLNDPVLEVEVVQCDAADTESAKVVCRGAAVVYNCVGLPYTEWAEGLPPIMDGIIAGAASAGAKLIYGDNLYMYGSAEEKLREDLPNLALGKKGRTRANIAEALMDADHNGKVRAAIGRAPDFYGPGALLATLGSRVFEAAIKGKPVELIGNIDLPHTHIFIDDFAKGLVLLGEREEALGEIWHIPSAPTMTTRKLVDMVYQEIGTKAKYRVAPKFVLKLMGLFQPVMREFQEVMYQFDKPFVVDHNKFQQMFGMKPTPHQAAIHQTMEWFKDRVQKQ